MSGFYRFVRALCKILVSVGFRVTVDGKENINSNRRVMICCNHQSFWDMPILIANTPYQIQFMAKKELFKNKLFTKVLLALGIIPVNRGAADISAIKTSIKALENGVLGIFPEGTRRALQKPSAAKSGAALLAMQTESEVLPMAINYNGKIRIFGKVNLNIGEPINVSSYLPAQEKKALPKIAIRTLSNDISNTITSLWEK